MRTTWSCTRRARASHAPPPAPSTRAGELLRSRRRRAPRPQFGDKLYTGLESTVTKHLREVAKQVTSANDDGLLKVLKGVWDKHKLSSIMIRDILMYMVRRTHAPRGARLLRATPPPARPLTGPSPATAWTGGHTRVTCPQTRLSHCTS